jgi:hypothetical protein
VTRQAQPLIGAIEKFRRTTGVYPEELEELIPKYIADLPSTGLYRNPSFSYRRASSGKSYKHYVLFVKLRSTSLNDALIYWPEGQYPARGGERTTFPKTIGEWAYYPWVGDYTD